MNKIKKVDTSSVKAESSQCLGCRIKAKHVDNSAVFFFFYYAFQIVVFPTQTELFNE